jgi:putative membrane protein
MNMEKHFNLQRFTELALLALTFIFIYLIANNNLSFYINPAYTFLIVLTLLFLFVLLFLMMNKLFKKGKSSIKDILKLKYLLFLIVIIMGFIPPEKNLSEKLSKLRGFNIGNTQFYARSSNIKNKSEKPQYNENIISVDKDVDIVFYDSNFVQYLNIIHANVAQYSGKTVKIKGFISKPKNIPQKYFIISRLMIACCAADASIGGFFCNAKPEVYEEVKENGWYEITAKIFSNQISINGSIYELPIFEVISYNTTGAPENPYVY